ncbi:HlyD family type I secretion periplasmic adaptor subunit [Aliarcobacter cryaerophilus]|uniref:HlyD family type I secretion periplasmic adaptor subunit n=1 Tax=Aliarcobacter cryaerophilus TaxID=28198 RepID=UPI0021B17705|nr:HlyD family type I secretion periplasmic adaptor subunit [Aliarcobacter cryaerophilus]MCT7506323.1 HlyD family type I secretion periplasmic adaptor subunit [Aliarcobacter cryaerophilus]
MIEKEKIKLWFNEAREFIKELIETQPREYVEKEGMPSGDDRRVVSFGLWVLFIVFVLFGGWMAIAPLTTSAVAVGTVSADTDKKVVQHLQGGNIGKIFVKEGDEVEKGQILVELDVVQSKSEYIALTKQYMDALAIEARLIANLDEQDSVVFPAEVVDENIIKDQTNIFNTINRSLKDQKNISLQRVEQLQNQISGLNSLNKVREKRIVSLNEELKELEHLFAQKLVDKTKIRELTREINSFEGDIASNKSEISKIYEQINEIKTQQLLSEKEHQNKTLDQLVQIKSDLSTISSKLNTLEDIVVKSEIKAPISGVVVGLKTHTEGAVIRPAEEILDIIPKDSDLLINAKVKINDIDKVKVGLLADIRFSAFNVKQALVIEAEVIHVSADRFIDEKSGEPYYEAKLKLTKKGIEQVKEYGFHLLPGMPAEVMIKIGERTPLSYFLKPFTDMVSRGFNEE